MVSAVLCTEHMIVTHAPKYMHFLATGDHIPISEVQGMVSTIFGYSLRKVSKNSLINIEDLRSMSPVYMSDSEPNQNYLLCQWICFNRVSTRSGSLKKSWKV